MCLCLCVRARVQAIANTHTIKSNGLYIDLYKKTLMKIQKSTFFPIFIDFGNKITRIPAYFDRDFCYKTLKILHGNMIQYFIFFHTIPGAILAISSVRHPIYINRLNIYGRMLLCKIRKKYKFHL